MKLSTLEEINAYTTNIISDNNTIDGLTVLPDVPNIESIKASFNTYKILEVIREIPMKGWKPENFFYAKNDFDRSRKLAEEIRTSGNIKPLIMVIEGEGEPYILEGVHRLLALYYIGKQSFPALVVMVED